MFKFIHVTDLHISGKTPKYRKDEFLETIIKKINWVNEYARKVNADAILCTGDIFDRPDASYGVLNRVIEVFSQSPVKWITIAGNHDEYGYNPETLKRTAYGALVSSGAVYDIVAKGGLNLTDTDEDNGVTVEICGRHCNVDIDTLEDKAYEYGGYLPPIKSETLRIHMVHGFLTDKDYGDLFHHTVISDIADSLPVDYLLCGHEHSGFGIIRESEVTFVNPGSLARVTSAIGDVNRIPKIAEITIDSLHTHGVKLVNVECYEDAEIVFDLEKSKQDKGKKKALSNFVSFLADRQKEDKKLSIYEAIDKQRKLMVSEGLLTKVEADKIADMATLLIREAHEKVGGEI